MRRCDSAILIAVLIAVLSAPLARANEPEFVGSTAANVQTLDCDRKAKNFEPFTLGWLVDGFSVAGGERSIRCTTRVMNEKGKGRKGVKVTLEAEILDLDGSPIVSLGTRSGRTNNAGQKVIDIPLIGVDDDEFLVGMDVRYGSNKKATTARTECTARNRLPCFSDSETLCLLDDNRFKVQVDWRDSGGSGVGQVLGSTRDSGDFYFFNPNNANLIVQLLNNCKNNDHFWVFASAFTNVEYDLTVTDTATGATKSYFNPLGQPAQAITDTSAFATCP